MPGTIAVDLTPVLVGGGNGGAKIFVFELLHYLAEIASQTRFVLLTHSASHAELAVLDSANVRRVVVTGPEAGRSAASGLKSVGSRLRRRLPARLASVMTRIFRRLNTASKSAGRRMLLRDLGADLLFCPFTAPTYAEPGIPTVCTIHDLQFDAYPEFFSPEDAAHRRQMFADACRRASSLAAVSDYTRNAAIAVGKIDGSRIHTIHHRMAMRISPSLRDQGNLLQRFALSPRKYFLYPANFWKHKNHEMLLTAFGIASRSGLAADMKLVCTGEPGARLDWLQRAAVTMSLDDRVVFPGFLPTAELATLLANCAGVVFPSLYEGFGLPVLEAMAAGVPVACANTTALPEVVADAAMLFDPRIPSEIAHAMTALNEEALRARLIQAGHRRAAQFSDARRMAGEYWQLFQDASGIQRDDASTAAAARRRR